MNDGLRKIEDFFKVDLEIKKMLHELVPPIDCNFDEEYIFKYSDKLFNRLETIKYYIIKTMSDFNMGYPYIECVNKLFENYNNRLIDCGMNFNKLKKFYNDNLSNMSESFIDNVKNNCCGYKFDRGYETIMKAQTINELLHFLHHTITNNEQYYQSMPKIDEKEVENKSSVILYGRQNIVAEKIYNNFPSHIDVGDTDIVALNNKVLVMIRDRGHALSIEIDIYGDECNVKYFIPKICNTLMINNLRGVHKVDDWTKFAVGEFRNNIDEIDSALFDFIENVPTDEHMFIEGGSAYEFSKGGR